MLRLSYTLHDHGWAVASITDGTTVVETDVSYLSDALGDLARAARGILRGLPETTFRFQQEPGEHRVIVSRDGDCVRLRVYRFRDTISLARDGDLLLDVERGLREFATACINCLRHVLDEHGETGYREKWKNHPFPLEEYHALHDLRRKL
jgi:hypothetical protein